MFLGVALLFPQIRVFLIALDLGAIINKVFTFPFVIVPFTEVLVGALVFVQRKFALHRGIFISGTVFANPVIMVPTAVFLLVAIGFVQKGALDCSVIFSIACICICFFLVRTLIRRLSGWQPNRGTDTAVVIGGALFSEL